jgi:hypothetical protein
MRVLPTTLGWKLGFPQKVEKRPAIAATAKDDAVLRQRWDLFGLRLVETCSAVKVLA